MSVREFYQQHGEKMRFLVVGVWNTAFGLFVIWVLDTLIPYDPGSLWQKQGILFAAWIVAVTQSFLTFKLIVFRTKGNWLREYGRVYVTYSATFVVQSALTLLLTELLDVRVFLASIPTSAVVMVLSYLGHKYFTFRDPSAAFEGRPGE